MSPATGATGKPMSYLFQVSGKADSGTGSGNPDPADCPHTHRTFRAGAWSCKRCGEAQ